MRSIVTQQQIAELEAKVKELEAFDVGQLTARIQELEAEKAKLQADFQAASEQLAALQNQGGSVENQEAAEPPAGEGGEGAPSPEPAPEPAPGE